MAATLDLAISAIRSGRKAEGRQLLNLLIQQDPNNDKAWLWMSSVVDADEQRARCLYHVLAIDPDSEIARRGLEILGIIVSDSRPVKIPRDSQPIQIPRPTAPQTQALPGQERRPFLVDPQTITQELPFTPIQIAVAEPIQASPSILAIDVEASPDATEATPEQANSPSRPVPVASGGGEAEVDSTALPAQNEPAAGPSQSNAPIAAGAIASGLTQSLSDPSAVQDQGAGAAAGAVSHAAEGVDTRPLPGQSKPVQQPADPASVMATTETQRMPDHPNQPHNPSEPGSVVQSAGDMGGTAQPQSGQMEAADGSGQVAGAAPIDPGGLSTNISNSAVTINQQPAGTPGQVPVPNETRPSQPVPVLGSAQNVYHNQYPYNSAPPAYPNHGNVTLGMPMQQPLQPQYPSQPVVPPHAAATMGMPIHMPNGQTQHPSEPVPVIHSSSTVGMVPYGQVQAMPPNMAIHSTSTQMMPAMSPAEAEARLMGGTVIPTASATAMALQNTSSQGGVAGNPALHGYPLANELNAETEDDDEINIMAVIIFGTLSITALGGLGMLILLIFTAPAG